MTSPDYDFNGYTDLSLQRLMVSDRPRTEAFAEGIKEVVSSGDRVIDFGTGTGVLAMLSAKAGAGKVFGFDQSAIAHVAEALVKANGLSDTVEIVHTNARELKLDEPVDLIVSEWLGHFAFTEAMLQSVLRCRDLNLKPGGKMLPSAVDLLLAPIESEHLYEDEGPGFWKINIHGIDFSSLEATEVKQAIAIKTMILPEEILAKAQVLVGIDLETAKEEDIWQAGELEFVFERDGQFHGFAGWFTAQLSPSVLLDTGPDQPVTHWRQTYFPLEPREVKAGETLRVRYALFEHAADPATVELVLTIDDVTHAFMVT